MNILFYATCQGAVLRDILRQRIQGWTNILNIHNYEFVLGSRYVLDDPALVENIRQADIIIYQPLGEHFGRNSSDNILAESRPGCQTITIPYAFNYGFWPIAHAARSDINTDEVLEPNALTFINLDPIHDLLDQGHSLDRVLDMFEAGEIDFNHKDRFRYCQDYLAKKEAKCDIKISDFIEKNYQQTKMFYYPSHPTLDLLDHMARGIIDLIDCQVKDQPLVENEIWLPTSKLPFWQGSIDDLDLSFSADESAVDYYKKLIKERFEEPIHE